MPHNDPLDPDTQPPKSTKRDWKRFQRLAIDRRGVSTRVKKAETATTRHAHTFIVKRLDSLREIRQHIIVWFAVVAVILLGVGVQLYLYGQSYTIETANQGGTYAEGVVGSLDTLNPLYASSSAEVAASRLMFSSLYAYDNTGALHSDIAKSTTRNAKGTKYTVNLREDITWHDGAKLTAKDVVFTVNTIKDRSARVRSSLEANWRDITISSPDEYTVEFTLPAYAAFVHALTFPIVPEHLLASVSPGALQESSFSQSPVGSGPFVYKLLQNTDISSQKKAVHMTANKSYFKGGPLLNRFELNAYPDDKSLVNALKQGEVTAADMTGDSAQDAELSDYVSQTYAIDNGVYALMNNTNPILTDKTVRQAIQRGIDVGAVREIAGSNLNELNLPFIESQVESASQLTVPTYDKQAAEKLLDKAGWKLKNGTRMKKDKTLTLTVTTTKNEQYERVTKAIVEQLKSLGIDATSKVIDDQNPTANFIQDVLQGRNYDMLVYELPIGADPDVYAYWHSSQLGVSGYNFTNYSNDTSDAALSSARDRLDPQLREAKYTVFAKQWLSDAPAIGLYQQAVTYVHTPDSQAMDDDARFVIASDRYANVKRWTVNQTRVYKTP